jgi:hypothetical protein
MNDREKRIRKGTKKNNDEYITANATSSVLQQHPADLLHRKPVRRQSQVSIVDDEVDEINASLYSTTFPIQSAGRAFGPRASRASLSSRFFLYETDLSQSVPVGQGRTTDCL